MTRIKLNSDLGESFGIYQLADETQIMPYIDQANIACGFHAGDPSTIHESIMLAHQNNLQIGAHPSYPDLQGFGRRSMQIEPASLTHIIMYQISAVQGMAKSMGTQVTYVKPHGALYNDLLVDKSVRNAVYQAVARCGKGQLALMLLASAEYQIFCDEASQFDIPLLFEAFADRQYTPDGKLTARSQPGAVLAYESAMAQAQRIISGGMPFPVDSLCVHGDTPEALALVTAIRNMINKE